MISGNLSRHQYKHRYLMHRTHSSNACSSSTDEKLDMIRLDRSRTPSILSFYDKDIEDENKSVESKWNIIRQRLPDILALSSTYKPASTQTQLTLLVRMMNRQTGDFHQSNHTDYGYNLSHIPENVVINMGGRRRLIYLKRIPPNQMIHVDVDQLSFSIPTRQFILAISRGNAHKTASKFCPPALSDLLINLSQTKVVNDGRQYKRALYKMRIGQSLFFMILIFISGMMLALIVSTAHTCFQLNSFDHTNPNLSTATFQSYTETDEYQTWNP